MLPRLSPPGVQQFIDSVTFSESAVDNMTIENRMEIANRALRFARQQDAAQKKKGISETQGERCFNLHTLFSGGCVGVCGGGGGTGRCAIFTTLQSYFPPRFGTLRASVLFCCRILCTAEIVFHLSRYLPPWGTFFPAAFPHPLPRIPIPPLRRAAKVGQLLILLRETRFWVNNDFFFFFFFVIALTKVFWKSGRFGKVHAVRSVCSQTMWDKWLYKDCIPTNWSQTQL